MEGEKAEEARKKIAKVASKALRNGKKTATVSSPDILLSSPVPAETQGS